MSYFIRIKNNEAFEHPIVEDNFKQAFPNIDIDNLPDEFARFVRVAPPTLGPYEIWTGATYEWDGDVMKDVHQIRDMTEEEKLAKVAMIFKTGDPGKQENYRPISLLNAFYKLIAAAMQKRLAQAIDEKP